VEFNARRLERLKTEMENDPILMRLNQPIIETRRVKAGPLAKALGIKPPEAQWIDLETEIHPVSEVIARHQATTAISHGMLTTLSVQEAFVVWMKICLVTGLVISSPWVFFQIWSFVAAGLYPHEKKLINLYLPFSLLLFLGGVFLCQFFVMNKAVE